MSESSKTPESTDNTSELWSYLSETLFAAIDDEFLLSFRCPGKANNRLATWDPEDTSQRFFKFALFSQALAREERFFEAYRNCGDVSLGQPVSVKVRGCDINADYLLSADEFLILENSFDLNEVKTVAEIGAGFGRTAHMLVTNLPKLQRYTIVDLPAMLNLSRAYLAKCLRKEEFDKLGFIDALDPTAWRGASIDLAININSFQEMRTQTIVDYLDWIDRESNFFYCKNPVGKYLPESVGLKGFKRNLAYDVFELGLCREIIDIFNDQELAAAAKAYVAAYRPSKNWEVVAERRMEWVPYYHHAAYRRSS